MFEVTTTTIATQGCFDKALDRIVTIATQGHFLYIVDVLSQSISITRHDGEITIFKASGVTIQNTNSKITIGS